MALDAEKVGILFPGQGAQTPGMGQALAGEHSLARDLFDQAGEILGYDLADLCFNGPAERLNLTVHSQPALFVCGIAAARVYQAEQADAAAKITCAAGLSLGEYTAVCFAGGLDFADALRLVQRRGEAMQAAADAVESGMASVLGLSIDELNQVCVDAKQEDEVLVPANLLCPGNIAVSGHKSALGRLEPIASEAGAMKVVPLAVAGAFHTELMAPAVDQLREALDEMPIQNTTIPVYSNVDAKPHMIAAEIRDLLSRQVVQPVQWEASVRQMIDDGVEGFLECGTGRVLRGTLKRIDRKFPSDGFGDS